MPKAGRKAVGLSAARGQKLGEALQNLGRHRFAGRQQARHA